LPSFCRHFRECRALAARIGRVIILESAARFAMKCRRARLPMTVLAMGALLAAGCAGGGQAGAGAPPGPVEKPDITVAAVPSFDAAGLYIAQQRGFFAQAGLHVTITPAVSAETVLASQLAGKLDVTFGNYVSYIQAMAERGARLHLLVPATVVSPNTQMIMTLGGSPIQGVTELAGKRVGVNAPDNIGTLLVDSVLNNSAVPVSAVKYVAVPFPLMMKALQRHQIDAAWLPEPFVTAAEESIGAEPLADADVGLAQRVPLVGYVCTRQWQQKYPRTAAAFAWAITRAQEIASQDSAAVQRASVAYTGITPQTAEMVSAPQFQLAPDPTSLQRLADLMLQFGLLRRGFSVGPFLH
jgi:NitT/TauT family transport system substrate-binding protein